MILMILIHLWHMTKKQSYRDEIAVRNWQQHKNAKCNTTIKSAKLQIIIHPAKCSAQCLL